MADSGVRIYVAGPMSGSGKMEENVRNAIAAADALVAIGLFPYVPHLTHFWNKISPHAYEEWLDMDLKWLAVCDAVLRLPGESPGAERETREAKRLGIPIFHSFDEIVDWYWELGGAS